MEYTTNQKGLITEMRVMLYFIELGYNVSQPLNADSRYDCIIDVNNKLLKIQIKTAHLAPKTENAIEIKCRSVTTTQNLYKEKTYNENEIDYFATYWDNEVYLIPTVECSNQKILHLNDEKLKANQCLLYDYKAKEILKAL